MLPWYLDDKNVNSSEDLSRSPKWRLDPDEPKPRKPFVVNAESKTWSPWRKNSASDIEQRTEVADEQRTTSFDQNHDFSLDYSEYEQQENQRFPTDFPDLEQKQEHVKNKGKDKLSGRKDSQIRTHDDDFYEGISADSTVM